MFVDLYVPCVFLYLLRHSTQSIQSIHHWFLTYFSICGKMSSKINKVHLSLKNSDLFNVSDKTKIHTSYNIMFVYGRMSLQSAIT